MLVWECDAWATSSASCKKLLWNGGLFAGVGLWDKMLVLVLVFQLTCTTWWFWVFLPQVCTAT
jgi:hypothetical protein